MESLQLLQRHFGFTEFMDGQREVIDALREQKAALAVFPTGGGKSLCYQLPALMFEGVTLVVSPLIALMKNQIDFLKSRGIAAERFDSSLTAEDGFDIMQRVREGKIKLLYIAPERFNNERFLSNISRLKISLFAVDEAHCMSEWGHNFRPDYLKLAEVARNLKVERVLALTATATPSVVDDICAIFQIPKECAIITGFYRQNLNLAITPVSYRKRRDLLLQRLQKRKLGATIIYVTLQKTAEWLAAYLKTQGFEAEAYHAGMESEDRSRVQENWMRSDTGIVVATIAFGMGIDKSNVRYVYHFNMPKSLESYSQEIGRAGRDGVKSTVELLACPDDLPTLENFTFGDTPTENSLLKLVEELLSMGDSFSISHYDLSARLDLRPLVLRTALTYLELLEVFKQGTPYYAGYTFNPLKKVTEIEAMFTGEPAKLVRNLFKQAKRGSKWYSLNPDEVAENLGQERRRIVRALEVLEQQGAIELKLSELKHRYIRQNNEHNAEQLAKELFKRFSEHEVRDIDRLKMVVDLVTMAGCQSNALASYFGEARSENCGHCTFCLTGKAQILPVGDEPPPFESIVNLTAINRLRLENPEALGDPRQMTRFLCGLTGPAFTKAKLSRHALFGSLETRRFQDVYDWVCLNHG